MQMNFRRMTRAELDTVLSWAADEGWNPGLDDCDAFFAADPQGFFVAEAEGRVVAAISVVNHTPEFAFLGLYLCLPAFRGRGIGYGLWQHALTHAGGRTIGLDGVPQQQDNYRKSGFALAGGTRRFVGRVPDSVAAQVRPMAEADLPALQDLDTKAVGYRRPKFLRPWLSGTGTRRTLVFASGACPVGSVTYRSCRDSVKIGPLMAPDMNVAEALLSAVSAAVPDGPLIIDVPDSQKALTAYCSACGMTVPFETARMYKGTPPPAAPDVVSVATLELG